MKYIITYSLKTLYLICSKTANVLFISDIMWTGCGCLMCVILVVFCTIIRSLGMLTLTVEHNYICYYIIGVYNNDMFQPYMWAIIRLWLDLELRLY